MRLKARIRGGRTRVTVGKSGGKATYALLWALTNGRTTTRTVLRNLVSCTVSILAP